MDLDTGDHTLSAQLSEEDPKMRRKLQPEDAKCASNYIGGEVGITDRVTREIPRVELRNKLDASRRRVIHQIQEAEKELHKLEQFEKTFFLMSEALQDSLAPVIGQYWYY